MTLPKETVDLLNEPLDPRRVNRFDAGPAKGAAYLDGEDVILTANRIFGYGGWSWDSDTPYLVQGADAPGHEVWACRGKLTIAGATVTGIGTNQRSGPGAPALEMCFKGAATDALKRAFVHWGDQFGLILREKVSDATLQKMYAAHWNGTEKPAPEGGKNVPPEAQPETPAVPANVDPETGEVAEDPGIVAYREVWAQMSEFGWKWGDEHVRLVLGMNPASAAEARDALLLWITAIKGRTPTVFIAQLKGAHAKLAKAS